MVGPTIMQLIGAYDSPGIFPSMACSSSSIRASIMLLQVVWLVMPDTNRGSPQIHIGISWTSSWTGEEDEDVCGR